MQELTQALTRARAAARSDAAQHANALAEAQGFADAMVVSQRELQARVYTLERDLSTSNETLRARDRQLSQAEQLVRAFSACLPPYCYTLPVWHTL